MDPTLERTPFHHRATHPPLRPAQCRYPNHLTCTSLGCGRTSKYLEKIHADMGRMWVQPGIDVFLICVLRKQHYLRTYLLYKEFLLETGVTPKLYLSEGQYQEIRKLSRKQLLRAKEPSKDLAF